MTMDIEPRLDAGSIKQAAGIAAAAAVADRLETEWLDAIEAITNPDEAEGLLGAVKTADEAVRVRKLGRDRVRRWGRVVLLAERKWAELRGPAVGVGGQGGNRNASKNESRASGFVSPEERAEAKAAAERLRQARKVAAVDPEEFNDYVNGNTRPTREGLLGRGSPPGPGRGARPSEGTIENPNPRGRAATTARQARQPARPRRQIRGWPRRGTTEDCRS